MLEEQRLDSRVHDCAGFDCGTPALNDYLTRHATQDRRRNLSQIYVLVDRGDIARVVGYYTLSAAHIDIDQLADDYWRRLPRYPIPCFSMGRFAVREELQGQGLGKCLLGCAVVRCLQARQRVAAYALIVDAKDASAKLFYEYFGFVGFVDRPLSLYLQLG